MTITIQTAHDPTQWDNLLARASYRTIFHTWEWLKIVEKHTNTKLYPLIGLKGTDPIGIFPIFYQEKGFFKLILSPTFKTALPYLGPLIIDYENMKQGKRESTLFEFLKAADKFIFSDLKGNHVRIISAPDLLDSRPLMWAGYDVEPLYTLTVDLNKSLDSIWKSFDKKLRGTIDKSSREGVSIEEGSIEDLDLIYDNLTIRLGNRGVRLDRMESAFHPDKPYLHDIFKSFYPQNLKIFIAKHKGEKVGGLLELCYEDKVSAWIGTPKVNLKNINPNDLIHFEAIKWAKENGFKYYEITDSGLDQHLCDYKSQFNPNLSIYFSVTKYSSKISRIARILRRTVRKSDLL